MIRSSLSVPSQSPVQGRQPGDKFVIMYHGSLVERNGLDLAVEALALVRRSIPNVQLKIYGRSTPFLETVMDRVRMKALDELRVLLRAEKPGRRGRRDREVRPWDHSESAERVFGNQYSDPDFRISALGKPVIAPRAAWRLRLFRRTLDNTVRARRRTKT